MINFAIREIATRNMENQLLEKARSMEKIKDVREMDRPVAKVVDVEAVVKGAAPGRELPQKLEPRTTYEVGAASYETDDKGIIYKTNRDLNPGTEYRLNEITYRTDDQGRIISWEGEPGFNPQAERDVKAQADAGGRDRLPGDDGGHLVARILDGSSGNENIVPMRDTVNRGDYKRVEGEIKNAKAEGKDVQDSGRVIYEGESFRPSAIERTYEIDGRTNVLKVDNVEGSHKLLEEIRGEIGGRDYEALENSLQEAEKDGAKTSVTSVLKRYDQDGTLESLTVGLRDEVIGTSYIKLDAA